MGHILQITHIAVGIKSLVNLAITNKMRNPSGIGHIDNCDSYNVIT